MLVKKDSEKIRVIRGEIKTDLRTQIRASGKRLITKLNKLENLLNQYHNEYKTYIKRIEKLEEHTGIVKTNKN